MAETIRTRVTELVMEAEPARRQPMPTRPRLALMRATRMPFSFYRYLYEQIGKPHHWMLRRDLPDEELAAAIHAETTHIDVLYGDGSPAGFFELDLSRRPEEVEIVYFGLLPEFQGMGLGRFLLSETIAAAWSYHPRRVVLQTNTLDSPKALRLYQLAGFVPRAWREEEITPWR